MDTEFMTIPMASGTDWTITPGHGLITLSLVMLFFELLKSTGIGRAAIMNHAFSMVLFIICLVEFLMFGAFRHFGVFPDYADDTYGRHGRLYGDHCQCPPRHQYDRWV